VLRSCGANLATTLALSSQALGQADEGLRAFPELVGDFRLVDSTELEAEGGFGLRYEDPTSTTADVYLYPIPPDRSALSDSTQLDEEMAAFIASLAVGPSRGWYDRYEVVIETSPTPTCTLALHY
jgi:hypothetical protein